MKIIFLTHHENQKGYSMTRYTNFLKEGMQKRDFDTEIWFPKTYFAKSNFPESLKKWLGYLDQFILFPIWFIQKSKRLPQDTLYVLTDQALGMWMPLIKAKKHVVHCHDFIALKSAEGKIKENPTSWSGKIYQKLILKGFSAAHNFIPISKNTQNELVQYLNKTPLLNEQVYNAIDYLFKPGSIEEARFSFKTTHKLQVKDGYILHVGGNGFYKNRKGVIAIYDAWRKQTNNPLPLLMIGYPPSSSIYSRYEVSPYKKDIHFLTDITNTQLAKAYQGARIFLFPSLFEGFGWPIAEAMACACPVITTDEAPMNEVGGDAAIYIDRCPSNKEMNSWATESAKILERTLRIPQEDRNILISKGLENVSRFNGKTILDQIEKIYKRIK
ncbi:glycosyltransferase family 4 protein [Zobellia galactanivorans]|uniref:Mannosyltransferase, family GT4 n=1 Tax=Zobellia galactanivorans (strain DSM 12802 / CCUG 47099 / CIP 106680 / NCIMB 13871 / Dsij) TaxID=63186 RepID=G0L2S9_ZOBGA|nr:glycosyltransferase family 1 protein [Zobellia galactanivorans]CAZ95171.1 Mannosyltransferase, family GT4 [Zobellia galactanivorans]